MGAAGTGSFGRGEQAGGCRSMRINISVAVDALVGVFDEEAFVAAMFHVAAEAGLLLLHVRV
jgi:hypothetical protein